MNSAAFNILNAENAYKLKELGFHQFQDGFHYDTDGNLIESPSTDDTAFAPSLDFFSRWLRFTKGLSIGVFPDENDCWTYEIYMYGNTLSEETLKLVHTYNGVSFPTFDEAVQNAIQYTLLKIESK